MARRKRHAQRHAAVAKSQAALLIHRPALGRTSEAQPFGVAAELRGAQARLNADDQRVARHFQAQVIGGVTFLVRRDFLDELVDQLADQRRNRRDAGNVGHLRPCPEGRLSRFWRLAEVDRPCAGLGSFAQQIGGFLGGEFALRNQRLDLQTKSVGRFSMLPSHVLVVHAFLREWAICWRPLLCTGYKPSIAILSSLSFYLMEKGRSYAPEVSSSASNKQEC